MRQRDEVERLVRGWHDFEVKSGASPVIDFDCAPHVEGEIVEGRFDVLRRLTALRSNADDPTVDIVDAHAAYLGALLGERLDLDPYVRRTQGCPAPGWTSAHLDGVITAAKEALARVDVAWNDRTRVALNALSPNVDAADAGEVIRGYAAKHEQAVRLLTGATADFELDVETVHLDAYWSYWLDGEGRRARLRVNAQTASFTELDAYRFALHEVLGHALQYANLTATAESTDTAWPRQLAIHCPHQVLFEGLAQVLPLAVSRDDDLVNARTRLDHVTQLVSAELHVMVNAGAAPATCREHAAQRVPFWGDGDVASILRDRALDPQLRSYLWAYPAGLDWFLAAHDAGGSVFRDVLQAGYQRPLVPRELEQLWPAGPRVGGDA